MGTIAAEWAKRLSQHMQARPAFGVLPEMPKDQRGKFKEIAYVAAVHGMPYLQVKAGMLTPAQAGALMQFIGDTIAEAPVAPRDVEPLPVPAPAPLADDDHPF